MPVGFVQCCLKKKGGINPMSFFKDLGHNISSKSKDLAQKAKDISETSSLNTIIKNEEFNIDTQYKLIGKQYYEKYSSRTGDEFEASILIISKSMEKIEATKAQIEKIKKRSCCPSCGASFKKGDLFCSKCGSAIPQPEKEPENTLPAAEPEKCPQCGEVIEDNGLFCTKCGLKLSADNKTENVQESHTVPESIAEVQTEKSEPTAPDNSLPEEKKEESPAKENSIANESQPTLNEETAPENADKKKCPQCGADAEENDLFCDECGYKF